jgi:hypothetical protein
MWKIKNYINNIYQIIIIKNYHLDWGRTYPDKGMREWDSVLLTIVARLVAIQSVLFSKQVQALISISTTISLGMLQGFQNQQMYVAETDDGFWIIFGRSETG